MDIINKQFNIKLNDIKQDRVISAIASTGKEDRAKDTLNMQNWILTDFFKNPVFLYAHNIDKQKVPIGKIINLKIVNDEMWIDIYFPKIEELTSYFDQPALIHDHAKFVDLVYNAYKCGLLKGISVGFTGKWTPKDPGDPWDGKNFTEQTLLEISAAPIPCNADALAKIGAIPDTLKQYIGGNMEHKTGQRLSKESRTVLESIHKEMVQAHNEYTKTIKGCHSKLEKFIEPLEDNNGNDEGQEEGKSFINLLENISNLTKE